MSAVEYAPGMVADVTLGPLGKDDEPSLYRRCFWDLFNQEWVSPTSGRLHANERTVTVRPLVVLDPADIPPLRDYLPELRRDYDTDDHRLAALADQIEAQTKPPKPAEPTGLGAVVESGAGNRYIRHGDGPAAWMLAGASPDNRDTYPYGQIDAVRVLSEGVTS